MPLRLWCSLPILFLCMAPVNWTQELRREATATRGGDASDNRPSQTRVPRDVILVKGAWSSGSGAMIPLPEAGSVHDGVFSNQYFGISYNVPPGWAQKYEGPPPSDTGHYTLTLLSPTSGGGGRASILFTAEDMFFTPLPVGSPAELVAHIRANLSSDYRVETGPGQTTIAGRTFQYFAYSSPSAMLHWYVLATEVRCHLVQIVLTGGDPELLRSMLRDMDRKDLMLEAQAAEGAEGNAAPVCIKDYARRENIITRVDPVLTNSKFNSIPIRIIIDKEGTVKHIHFISAFDDQAKVIADALEKWKFKPYVRDGRPVEMETGLLFGPPAIASQVH